VTLSVLTSFPRLQVSMFESASRLHGSNRLLSNPLLLNIAFDQKVDRTGEIIEEIAGVAVFTLQNNVAQDYDDAVIYQKQLRTYCNGTTALLVSSTCPNGFIMTHQCAVGAAGVWNSTCPPSTWQPVCTVIDGMHMYTSVKNTQCERLGFTTYSTTCSCTFPNFNIVTKYDTLELTTVGAFLPDLSTYFVSFDEDASFETSTTSESFIVSKLVISVWGIGSIFVFLCILLSDYKERFSGARLGKVSSDDPSMVSVIPVSPVSGQEKVSRVLHVLRSVFPPESFYPRVHSWQRLCRVVWGEHMYTRMFFNTHSKAVRISNVFRLVTGVTWLLFAVTVVMELQFPNNESICSSKTNSGDCLAVTNVFDNEQRACRWYQSGHVDGNDIYTCHIKHARLTLWGVTCMVLLMSCFYVPANIFLDYIFNDYILRPTSQPSHRDLCIPNQSNFVVPTLAEESNIINEVDPNFSCSGEDNSSVADDVADLENNCNERDEALMKDLMSKIRMQRLFLPSESGNVKEFDQKWQWDGKTNTFQSPNNLLKRGKRQLMQLIRHRLGIIEQEPPQLETDDEVTPFHSTVYARIMKDVTDTVRVSEQMDEVLNTADSSVVTEAMLKCFVVDYLGRLSTVAKVFSVDQERVLSRQQFVSWTRKVTAFIFIVLLDAGLLIYTLIVNLNREAAFQESYLHLFVIQILIEVVWFEFMLCVWMCYGIPLTISDEVQGAISVLRECATNAFLRRSDLSDRVLNAAKYLFVSMKIAANYPHMLEAQTVLAYHSFYPHLCGNGILKLVKGDESPLYAFTIAFWVSKLLTWIGACTIWKRRAYLNCFQLVAAFCILGCALLLRKDILWVLPLAILGLYEGAMWIIFVHWKNDVHSEYSVPGHEEVVVRLPFSPNKDGLGPLEDDIVVGKKMKTRGFTTPAFGTARRKDLTQVHADASVHDPDAESSLVEDSAMSSRYSAMNWNTPLVADSSHMPLSKHTAPKKILADAYELSSDSSSGDDIRLSEATTRKRNLSTLPGYSTNSRRRVTASNGGFSARSSIFNPRTPSVDFSPSVASLAFNQPKKKVVPPKKMAASLFELSSGSESSGGGDEAVASDLGENVIQEFVPAHDFAKDNVVNNQCEVDSKDVDRAGDSVDDSVDDAMNALKQMMNVVTSLEPDREAEDDEDEGDYWPNMKEEENDFVRDDDSIEDFNRLMDTFNMRINAMDSDSEGDA